jgi:XTP/dITP diphosphohydrolase
MYFVTGNKVKLAEAQAFFPSMKSIKLDLVEIQSLNAEEVMMYKLQEAAKSGDGREYVVDDFCFGLDCLNGFPGTMVKWFEESTKGGEADYVTITSSYQNNRASVTSSVGWTDGKQFKIFSNKISGTIVESRPGVGNGCYTVFLPNGCDKTLSQMTDNERNAISPRGKCFEELKFFLKGRSIE